MVVVYLMPQMYMYRFDLFLEAKYSDLDLEDRPLNGQVVELLGPGEALIELE